MTETLSEPPTYRLPFALSKAIPGPDPTGIDATILLVATSMTVTFSPVAAYRLPFALSYAMPQGDIPSGPRGIDMTPRFVAPSMTVTLLESNGYPRHAQEFVTYTSPFELSNATPRGWFPTGTHATT